MWLRRLAAALFIAMIACSFGCGGDPTDKLIGHAENIGEILEDNVDSPKDGVVAARKYYRKHLPDILAQLGEILSELDAIEDADARAKRAKEIVETLTKGMSEAMPQAAKFAEALDKDKEAQKLMKEIGESWAKTGKAFGGISGLPF